MRPSELRRAGSAKRCPRRLSIFAVLPPLLLAAATRVAAEPEAAPDLPVRETAPVTVTATRGERSVLEAAGNVSVIDREAIDRNRAASLPDLLRRQAGLSVMETTTNPAGTVVEARGFSNGGSLGSSLLVLVDGRRVNEADTANTDWALIPLDSVERVEIVRGPVSALYGDNAVGGVINIVTRPRSGLPQVTLRGGGGSYATGHGSLSASGSGGPVTASLFVDGTTTDGYRHRSAFDAQNVEGQAELQLGERVAWGLGGGWHDDHRDFPGALTQDEIALLGRRAAAPGTLSDGADVERGFVRSWLEATLRDDLLLRLQPYYSRRDEDVTITSDFGGKTTIDYQKGSLGVDAELQLDRSIGSFRNRLTLGTAFLLDETDRDILSGFGPLYSRNDRRVYAGFLQNELNLTRDLLLSGGVRFDYADYTLRARDALSQDRASPDFALWSPRAALSYRLAEPAAVYFSYAQGFRLPNFDENAPVLPFSGDGETLIPDLEPQRSESFEIGGRFQGERVQAALALYHMQVKNEIIYDPVLFSNVNFNRVRHRGIELSLSGHVLAWLRLYASYTLEDVEIRRYTPNPDFEGKRMPINPLQRGTAGLVADLPLGLEAGVNANVVGPRYLANDFANALPQLDEYATVDLLLTWRPPFADLGEFGRHLDGALTFAVRNVGGEGYFLFGADNSAILLPPDFEPALPGFNPAPKRSFETFFRLQLKR